MKDFRFSTQKGAGILEAMLAFALIVGSSLTIMKFNSNEKKTLTKNKKLLLAKNSLQPLLNIWINEFKKQNGAFCADNFKNKKLPFASADEVESTVSLDEFSISSNFKLDPSFSWSDYNFKSVDVKIKSEKYPQLPNDQENFYTSWVIFKFSHKEKIISYPFIFEFEMKDNSSDKVETCELLEVATSQVVNAGSGGSNSNGGNFTEKEFFRVLFTGLPTIGKDLDPNNLVIFPFQPSHLRGLSEKNVQSSSKPLKSYVNSDGQTIPIALKGKYRLFIERDDLPGRGDLLVAGHDRPILPQNLKTVGPDGRYLVFTAFSFEFGRELVWFDTQQSVSNNPKYNWVNIEENKNPVFHSDWLKGFDYESMGSEPRNFQVVGNKLYFIASYIVPNTYARQAAIYKMDFSSPATINAGPQKLVDQQQLMGSYQIVTDPFQDLRKIKTLKLGDDFVGRERTFIAWENGLINTETDKTMYYPTLGIIPQTQTISVHKINGQARMLSISVSRNATCWGSGSSSNVLITEFNPETMQVGNQKCYPTTEVAPAGEVRVSEAGVLKSYVAIFDQSNIANEDGKLRLISPGGILGNAFDENVSINGTYDNNYGSYDYKLITKGDGNTRVAPPSVSYYKDGNDEVCLFFFGKQTGYSLHPHTFCLDEPSTGNLEAEFKRILTDTPIPSTGLTMGFDQTNSHLFSYSIFGSGLALDTGSEPINDSRLTNFFAPVYDQEENVIYFQGENLNGLNGLNFQASLNGEQSLYRFKPEDSDEFLSFGQITIDNAYIAFGNLISYGAPFTIDNDKNRLLYFRSGSPSLPSEANCPKGFCFLNMDLASETAMLENVRGRQYDPSQTKNFDFRKRDVGGVSQTHDIVEGLLGRYPSTNSTSAEMTDVPDNPRNLVVAGSGSNSRYFYIGDYEGVPRIFTTMPFSQSGHFDQTLYQAYTPENTYDTGYKVVLSPGLNVETVLETAGVIKVACPYFLTDIDFNVADSGNENKLNRHVLPGDNSYPDYTLNNLDAVRGGCSLKSLSGIRLN